MKKTIQTPKKFLQSTGHTLYINDGVVEEMPMAGEAPVEFFNLDRLVKPAELYKEYTDRGLKPAAVDTMLLCNQDTLDEKKYVATQWVNKDGTRQ